MGFDVKMQVGFRDQLAGESVSPGITTDGAQFTSELHGQLWSAVRRQE